MPRTPFLFFCRRKDSLPLSLEDPVLHKSWFPNLQISQTPESRCGNGVSRLLRVTLHQSDSTITCGFLVHICVLVKNQRKKKKAWLHWDYFFSPTCHYLRIPARNCHSTDIKPKANYILIPERVLQWGQRDAVVNDHIHFIMHYCTTSLLYSTQYQQHFEKYPLTQHANANVSFTPTNLFKTYLGVTG